MEQLQWATGYEAKGGEILKDSRMAPQWQLAWWWENCPVGGGIGRLIIDDRVTRAQRNVPGCLALFKRRQPHALLTCDLSG